MGMVIIIVVAVIWGVYEVYNSIGFKNNENIVSNETERIIEMIKNTEVKEERRNQIEFYLREKRITQEDANELG